VEFALRSSKGAEFLSLARQYEELRRQPPAWTLFEQVAFHLQEIAKQARRCGNPECTSPYFFAVKKGQKYCSETCAAPSQRAQKLRWWTENRGKGRKQ
jgi:hypothetical protein